MFVAPTLHAAVRTWSLVGWSPRASKGELCQVGCASNQILNSPWNHLCQPSKHHAEAGRDGNERKEKKTATRQSSQA
jgi:hypothetical protein